MISPTDSIYVIMISPTDSIYVIMISPTGSIYVNSSLNIKYRCGGVEKSDTCTNCSTHQRVLPNMIDETKVVLFTD